MRLPRTSRQPSGDLEELHLGRGDYVAGGARSLPFLDLDGARRRRPLVFGEVTDDLSAYPALAADMFSGRQADVGDWAVMWREIGADGVWIDLRGGDASVVREVCDRTRLPVAVTADEDVLAECAGIADSRMIVFGRDGTYRGPAGDHAVAVGGRSADGIADACLGMASSGMGRMVIDLGDFVPGESLGRSVALAEEVRSRALAGEAALAHPTVANTSRSWDMGFSDARQASMWEAGAALAAMLAGADIVIVRGPGAADMARVYGEELADL